MCARVLYTMVQHNTAVASLLYRHIYGFCWNKFIILLSEGPQNARVYNMHSECGLQSIGQTIRTVEGRIVEHKRQ